MLKNLDDNQKKLIHEDLRNRPPIVPRNRGYTDRPPRNRGGLEGLGKTGLFSPQAWGAKGQYLRKSCSRPLSQI